jgi:hypothetical protein
MTARADCGRTFARSQDHLDALLVGTETGVLIDKTSEMVAAVQDRSQFNGGETSTINRPQAQVHDFGKPWAASQIGSPRWWIRAITGAEVRDDYTAKWQRTHGSTDTFERSFGWPFPEQRGIHRTPLDRYLF